MERLGQRAKRTGNISAGLVDQHFDQTVSKIRKLDRKIQNRNGKLKQIYDWNKMIRNEVVIQGWSIEGIVDRQLELSNAISEVADLSARLSELADKRISDIIVSMASIIGKEITTREKEITKLEARIRLLELDIERMYKANPIRAIPLNTPPVISCPK